MRVVIDRKIYDTEKAEMVASSTYSKPGDFHYWSEKLYHTKAGRWFLLGEGGARSRFATKVSQNTWGPGKEVVAMTTEDAIVWCEMHNEPDVIEKYFSDYIEEA